MIAQPSGALYGQFPLDPGAGLSPVEQAILAGLSTSATETSSQFRLPQVLAQASE